MNGSTSVTDAVGFGMFLAGLVQHLIATISRLDSSRVHKG